MSRKVKKISNITVNQEGDWSDKFEKVYRTYFSRLYAYSRAIVDSQSMAKDIVSEFFFRLWNSKKDLQDIQNLEMYLYVSVRNLSFKTLNKDSNFDSLECSKVKMKYVDYINPEELLLEKELLNVLKKIISNLPDQCQLIFRLSREEGLNNSEIAEELGISVATVNSQKKKALAKLKAGILKYYHDNDDFKLSNSRLIGQYILLICCNIYN